MVNMEDFQSGRGSSPFCSLLAQNLGHSIHDPQVGAQSIMQALIVYPRLCLGIGQSSLAFDHTLCESATYKQPIYLLCALLTLEQVP